MKQSILGFFLIASTTVAACSTSTTQVAPTTPGTNNVEAADITPPPVTQAFPSTSHPVPDDTNTFYAPDLYKEAYKYNVLNMQPDQCVALSNKKAVQEILESFEPHESAFMFELCTIDDESYLEYGYSGKHSKAISVNYLTKELCVITRADFRNAETTYLLTVANGIPACTENAQPIDPKSISLSGPDERPAVPVKPKKRTAPKP